MSAEVAEACRAPSGTWDCSFTMPAQAESIVGQDPLHSSVHDVHIPCTPLHSPNWLLVRGQTGALSLSTHTRPAWGAMYY